MNLMEMLVESIELRARTPKKALTNEDYLTFLDRAILVLSDMKYYAESHPPRLDTKMERDGPDCPCMYCQHNAEKKCVCNPCEYIRKTWP